MEVQSNNIKRTRSASWQGELSLQQKWIGVARMLFGLMWAVAAILKWQPAFISSFASTIESAAQGQPAFLQGWFHMWTSMVHTNPGLFAILTGLIESLLAICFLFGVFTNSAALLGMIWSFFVWAVANGFGGPYVAGHSTDIGTGFPYILLCGLFLLIHAGRYLGIDRALTPKLGHYGLLASGSWEKRV